MHTAKHGWSWTFGCFLPWLGVFTTALSAWGATPLNNNFVARFPLDSVPYTTASGANNGATVEPGEQPACYDAAFRTVWWSWTAPYSGVVEINTTGSDFDTLMAVYTNNLAGINSITNITKVAASDDYTNYQSRVVFQAESGEDYHIQVDGYNGYFGRITVNVRMGPDISIASPVDGEVVMIPPPVTTLSANASAYGPATVLRVDYFVGSNHLGRAFTAPYNVAWSNLTVGDYTLRARAVDSGGLTNTSAPVTITVDRYPPPDVAITWPLEGDAFNLPGPIKITADARAGDGLISLIEFFEGTNKLGETASEPFQWVWDNVFAGPYTLTAVATDSHGQQSVSVPVSITVTGMPPDVILTSPPTGQNFITPGVITLAAEATVAIGTIARIEFLDGATVIGEATNTPFSLVWSNPLPGNCSVTARATDSYGLANTSVPADILVYLLGNDSPAVRITSPADGASFPASAAVTLRALAYDPDDAVARVEFYGNGTKLGAAVNPVLVNDTNWMFSLVISNVLQPGSWALTAWAIDSLGATSALSAAVNVMVTQPTTSEWVAYNDEVAGPDTNPNATSYTIPYYGLSIGALRNIATGDNLMSYLVITNSAGVTNANTMTSPAAGTPAAEIFAEHIDFESGTRKGLELLPNGVIGYVFTGLNTNKVYRFMATAVRGEPDYTNRWTRAEIVGASYYTPAHSSNVITAAQFPAALTPRQAAFNAGVNHTTSTGDIINWDNIVPGPSGSFAILCTKYNGAFYGGSGSTGSKSYAFAALRLEQTSGRLLVNVTKPENNSWHSYPATIAVSASAQGLPVPTNVLFYANNSLIGSKASAPYTISWRPGAIRDYRLTAIARGSGGSVTSTVVNVSLVSNTAPIVSLDTPAPAEIFGTVDTIQINASASDPGGTIARLEYYADNTLLGTDTSAPYSFAWTNMLAGSYALRVVATDNGGLMATSAPVNIEVRQGSVVHIYDGPILQSGSTNTIVVCWRTTDRCDSRVRYGTNPANLNLSVQSSTPKTNHQMQLTGLQPDTCYYYTVEAASIILSQSTNNFFHTAPATTQPIRIWVIGDTRTGDANQRAVRDAYYQYAGNAYTDLLLMNGDNAGADGTDLQFHVNFLGMFSKVLRQTPAYPVIGNHDSYTANAGPYLDIFALPTNGVSGGVPSGTERYYSFDYGNVHFVTLDSSTSDKSVGGPMYNWLLADLAANTKDWLIAYFHHAPYSRGNHNSDNDSDKGYAMGAMRTNFLPVLEASGVDLVLGGHSHVYERSYFIGGHYGTANTFNPATMVKDGGDGRAGGSGPYRKPARGPIPHSGTVYNVVGSSGLISCSGTLNHPVMYYSRCNLGSLVIDITGNRLDAQFLRETGAIDDSYTIIKGGAWRITSIAVGAGTAALEWETVAGAAYQVFYKDNLGNASWTAVSARLPAASSRMTWSHTPPSSSAGFYLIQQVP